MPVEGGGSHAGGGWVQKGVECRQTCLVHVTAHAFLDLGGMPRNVLLSNWHLSFPWLL